MPSPFSPTKPDRPLRRLLIIMALLVASLFVLAFVVAFAGIHLLGGIENSQQWLDDHAGHFFVWRLCLYAAVLAVWPWVRRRRLARDPQSHRQLRRVEVLGVLAIVLSEASNWLRLH